MTVKVYGFKDKMFEDLATFGEKNSTLADRFCALLLALSPILQFYKGFYRNAGFTVLLLVSPLIVLKFLVALKNGNYDMHCMGAIIPMLLFQIFKMLDHTVSVNKAIYCFFFVLLFMAISAGSINVKLFIKYAAAVSVVAAILLAVQYFCYYILGFHLKLAPTSLF